MDTIVTEEAVKAHVHEFRREFLRMKLSGKDWERIKYEGNVSSK